MRAKPISTQNQKFLFRMICPPIVRCGIWSWTKSRIYLQFGFQERWGGVGQSGKCPDLTGLLEWKVTLSIKKTNPMFSGQIYNTLREAHPVCKDQISERVLTFCSPTNLPHVSFKPGLTDKEQSLIKMQDDTTCTPPQLPYTYYVNITSAITSQS